ncbi:hypothetical protein RRG08_036264 [Elysia crispata]|uniref:Uncharacterized protein n=1 Tax=Elysia crispata TaxID=231223 RepID=A0AAE0YWZ4_9GAST|nr:hypothetical protein RRG08_036264 [Elysia crispata]
MLGISTIISELVSLRHCGLEKCAECDPSADLAVFVSSLFLKPRLSGIWRERPQAAPGFWYSQLLSGHNRGRMVTLKFIYALSPAFFKSMNFDDAIEDPLESFSSVSEPPYTTGAVGVEGSPGALPVCVSDEHITKPTEAGLAWPDNYNLRQPTEAGLA